MRDGARGPGDLGSAPTEAHFMWAETSNLRGTDVPRLHEKKTSTGCISLVIRARDGARGPGDLGSAPTEAHFMWAETSNLRGTDVPRLHEKRTSTGCPFFLQQRARDGTRTRGLDLGKVALHQLSHSRIFPGCSPDK